MKDRGRAEDRRRKRDALFYSLSGRCVRSFRLPATLTDKSYGFDPRRDGASPTEGDCLGDKHSRQLRLNPASRSSCLFSLSSSPLPLTTILDFFTSLVCLRPRSKTSPLGLVRLPRHISPTHIFFIASHFAPRSEHLLPLSSSDFPRFSSFSSTLLALPPALQPPELAFASWKLARSLSDPRTYLLL